MKKLVIALIAAVGICAIAIAGSVYDRTSNITVTSGTGVWTNTINYAAIKLLRVYVYTNTAAAGTVTVTRTASGYSSQAVGSITCSGGAGTTSSFTQTYAKPGDIFTFTEGAGSNAVCILEYEVQKH